MDNKSKKLLFDILTSIDNIESYVGDKKVFAELKPLQAPARSSTQHIHHKSSTYQ